MKKIAPITCGLVLVCFSAMSQGTILFRNLDPASGLDAPVRMPDGTLVPVNQGYTVELLAGMDVREVFPFATPITGQFVAPGYFGIDVPESVLAGFPPGSRPWFQVRAWKAHLGGCTDVCPLGPNLWGFSLAFQLQVPEGLGNPNADPPVPAPALVGLQTFAFIAGAPGLTNNTWVMTRTWNLNVLSSPCGSLVGTVSPGSLGIVLNGPLPSCAQSPPATYFQNWEVWFTNGLRGWVTDEYLIVASSSFTSPIRLSAVVSESKLTLSWPTNSPRLQLQSTTSLRPPVSWNTVTNLVVDVGDRRTVVEERPNGNRFYRLILP